MMQAKTGKFRILRFQIIGRFRVRAGIHGPKPIGPEPSGSVRVIGPNQDREIFKTWDRIGPGPRKIFKYRTGPDQ